MSISGKKFTLTNPTPVQILEGDSDARELVIATSSRRLYFGDSPSISEATSFLQPGNQQKSYMVPAGVDVYAMYPDEGVGTYPVIFHALALPRDGGTGVFKGTRLSAGSPLSSTPTPLHDVSDVPLVIELRGYTGGAIRIGSNPITSTDGFEAGPGPYRVEPGDQLFAVLHDAYPTPVVHALVSTYIPVK